MTHSRTVGRRYTALDPVADAIVGIVSSTVILYYVQRHTDVHFFLYGAIGILSCVILGYLASLLIPSPKICPDNLTILK